ncbi:hypothetical protein [Pseudorhodobacter sp.]|uniref:hypothetical protein n=1 Tax=Pseudorhodobacter sp. TaxID=1934400 RepID=UPI002647F09E|nr:hypothetical protein [Pseudorhodobacter sp.]MDN5786033.1 hypothetical protein [Pseudorhodobacter sp.]
MAVTALLYFGPLLAGLAGFGWAIVPVFAAIFMLWLVIIRPQDFPRSVHDWARPEALVAFAARAAVQLLLVVMCFGIGRGIGGVMGSLPSIPTMLPIAISFLSIPLARMVWNPWEAQAMDNLLDDALTKIETGKLQGGDRAYGEAVLAPLNGLSDNVTEAELQDHLTALRALVDEGVTYDILVELVESGKASLAVKRALMLLGSDAGALERMQRQEVPVRVLQVLRDAPALVSQMAGRLTDALERDPELWHDLPNVSFLEGLRVSAPDASQALDALMAEVIAQAPGA